MNHAENLNVLRKRMSDLVSLAQEDVRKAENNMLEIAKEKYIGKVIRHRTHETLFLIDRIHEIEHIFHFGPLRTGVREFTMNVTCQSVCPVEGRIGYWKKSTWTFNLGWNGDLLDADLVDRSEFEKMKTEALARIDSLGRELKTGTHVYFADNGVLFDGTIESFETETGLVCIRMEDGNSMSKKPTELLRK